MSGWVNLWRMTQEIGAALDAMSQDIVAEYPDLVELQNALNASSDLIGEKALEEVGEGED